MVYASYRCRVQAPLTIVWSKLREAVKRLPRDEPAANGLVLEPQDSKPERQRLRLASLVLEEEIHCDSEKKEITLCIEDQSPLTGVRRFALKKAADDRSVLVESLLDWRATDRAYDDLLFQSAKVLVRDLLLDLKEDAEAS